MITNFNIYNDIYNSDDDLAQVNSQEKESLQQEELKSDNQEWSDWVWHKSGSHFLMF